MSSDYEYSHTVLQCVEQSIRTRTKHMATAATVSGQEEHEQIGKAAGPCVMVLFGASGDLTKRKLVPALYNLVKAKLLPKNFAVVGVAFDDLSRDQFRDQVTSFLQCRGPGHRRLGMVHAAALLSTRRIRQSGHVFDPGHTTRRSGQGTRHASQLPVLPGHGAKVLCSHCSATGQGRTVRPKNGCWRRVVIEKPFGHDLDSAKALNRDIKAVLAENQIYRIDHYLGKETVQNIMVFRFDNAIFEPIWNRRYIDHVQITNAETVGVECAGDTLTPRARCATWCPTTSCSCSA